MADMKNYKELLISS